MLARRAAEGVAVRLFVWDMPLPLSALRAFYPQAAVPWFAGTGVDFRLDAAHPRGASRHQKLVVVDERLAFCAGGDFGANRWDSRAHLARDPRRRLPRGGPYPARHDVAMLVEGEAAGALAELARERWARVTGETIGAHGATRETPWPERLAHELEACSVGIARTEARYGGQAPIREIEALHLAAIAAARRRIYVENQYLASPLIADALAARLREPGGPRIIAVLPPHSPGHVERLTMDSARDAMLRRLRGADRYGRFRAYMPVTAAGAEIIVHSKVLAIDDRLLVVGSANLNNRSMGFDGECALALDAFAPGAPTAAVARTIARFVRTAFAHYPRLQSPGRAAAHAVALHRGALPPRRSAEHARQLPSLAAPAGRLTPAAQRLLADGQRRS